MSYPTNREFAPVINNPGEQLERNPTTEVSRRMLADGIPQGLNPGAQRELQARTAELERLGLLPVVTLSEQAERLDAIRGANNVLRNPGDFGGNTRPGSPEHNSFLRQVATATDTLRANGQLTAIEQGRSGQMPELIAEYARTHFNALSGNTANITRNSIQNYIDHTSGITPFARNILTQMQERFGEIANGSRQISLPRLETYRSNAAVATEAMAYLRTDVGWRTFAGAEANGTTRTYIHRDHVGQQMQNFENRLREPNLSTADRAHYESLRRIGHHLQTQIAGNDWDNHVNMNSGINSVVSYANRRGYRDNDAVIAPVQQPQLVPPPEVARPNPNVPQSPVECQPQTSAMIPEVRPEWARPGSNSPERQVMNQTLAMLTAPGDLNVNGLRRLLNQQPETMQKVVEQINQELRERNSLRSLSLTTGYNPDGSVVRTLQVLRNNGMGLSTPEADIVMGRNEAAVRPPERPNPWQQRVSEQILGNNGFVGEENYQAAATRARATGLPLVVVFGREGNQPLLQGSRDRLQRGEAVVLYTDGTPRPNTYLGQVHAAAGEWIGHNGGAIRVDLRANTFTPEQLLPRPQRVGAPATQVNDSQRCDGPTCSTPIRQPQETYVASTPCHLGSPCGGYSNVVPFRGRPVRCFSVRGR